MKIEELNEILSPIQGLEFQSNWRLDNGKDSYVVPFAITRIVSIVYHGEKKEFDYGHYGIHLGQEDRLTFLGQSSKKIKGLFIDCRKGSETLHKKVEIEFSPSSDKILCIPNGVAHTFKNLQNIFTINSYNIYLPEPSEWVNGESQWSLESDVINVPLNAKVNELPVVKANRKKASDLFYKIIGDNQKETFPKLKHEYPFTENFVLRNGEEVKLQLKKITNKLDSVKPSDDFEIDGVEWIEHIYIKSGDNSGFITLLDETPFYVVDHGESNYSHDAFGIHLGAEDRLTFLGSSTQEVKITLVDCRDSSKTLHKEVTKKFNPSPLFYLKIPNGVAHRFEGLENVFTINRSVVYAEDETKYNPSNDVIDWDINNKCYPIFKVSKEPVSKDFYIQQAKNQRELISKPPQHSTPMIFIRENENGETVKVAIRKKEDTVS